MLGAALVVALGPVADMLPAAAQSAPATQQAPFFPFPLFPSATPSPPSPTEAGRPATREVESTRAKQSLVQHHPSRRKVDEKKASTGKLAVSNRNERKIAERKGYKRVSELVNFPKFFPGLGIIFVKPNTLPTGPFLCFDRKDHLVATVYMVPTKDIDDRKTIEAAAVAGPINHVTFYFNPGHPGVDMPHYHFVIWHVSKKDEARVAQ
jgi:hypothetical protein